MRNPNTECEVCHKPLYRRPSDLARWDHVCCKGCRSALYKQHKERYGKNFAKGRGWNKGMSKAAGDALTYGRPRSDETKRKISEALRGKMRVERCVLTCVECGKVFTALPSQTKRGLRSCSIQCANKHNAKQREYPTGRDNPNYRGGHYKPCEICEKQFWVIPAKADIKRFCSNKCRYKGQSEYMVERNPTQRTEGTDIEIILEQWLVDHGIVFESQKPVEKITRVDFSIPPNICLYADGDYWHSLDETKSRDVRINRQLKHKGYRVIRLLGSDIKKGVGPNL